MALCNITGVVYLPNGALAKSREFVVRAVNAGVVVDGPQSVIMLQTYMATDGDGNADLSLYTGRYSLIQSDGLSIGVIAVPNAPTANMGDILL